MVSIPAVAQEAVEAPRAAAPVTEPSPILTLDQDALFMRSEFGQRVQRELERDREALAAENRRIEADLVAEERALTEKRPTLSIAEFSELSKAFDDRVQTIRSERERKSRALQNKLEDERQRFLSAIGPILAELVQRRGGVAVIDRKVILLSFESIDITEEAVRTIDERIGAGESPELSEPAQGPDTEGEPADAPAAPR
jgi:Skp family chaperone for outer membrane proteins